MGICRGSSRGVSKEKSTKVKGQCRRRKRSCRRKAEAVSSEVREATIYLRNNKEVSSEVV